MAGRYGGSLPHVPRDQEFGKDDPAGAMIGGTDEARVDAIVQRRLAVDAEYLHAEDAEQQAEREAAITRQAERRVELEREIASARRLGRDPQRQLCELASIEEQDAGWSGRTSSYGIGMDGS